MGNRLPMVTADVEALAAVGDGADEDGLPGAVVILRVGFWGFGLPVAVSLESINAKSMQSIDLLISIA